MFKPRTPTPAANVARRGSACRGVQAVAKSLLAAALALVAMGAYADSAMIHGNAGQQGASARLDFRIVVPPVLVLDTKTGTMYSNDTRMVALLGTRQDDAAVRRVSGVTPDAAGLQPVAGPQGQRGASAGAAGIRIASRGPARGDVLCTP
ncbi:MAG: hypothetical protein ABI624_20460 [Casimicrobiaceae bacterium]